MSDCTLVNLSKALAILLVDLITTSIQVGGAGGGGDGLGAEWTFRVHSRHGVLMERVFVEELRASGARRYDCVLPSFGNRSNLSLFDVMAAKLPVAYYCYHTAQH